MTTDFRALCADLLWALENAIRVSYHEDGTKHISTANPIVNRARAALAVPDGGEPAAVTAKPSDEDSTVMEIIELSSEIEAAGLGQVDFARAVLARWGNPAPVPPADGEVAKLVAKLRRLAPQNPLGTADPTITRAVELLQRQAPVPVSERLPGPEDCDAEGRCWWFAPETEVDFGGWTFGTTEICANSQWVDWENTHWLPAHALPLPEVGE